MFKKLLMLTIIFTNSALNGAATGDDTLVFADYAYNSEEEPKLTMNSYEYEILQQSCRSKLDLARQERAEKILAKNPTSPELVTDRLPSPPTLHKKPKQKKPKVSTEKELDEKELDALLASNSEERDSLFVALVCELDLDSLLMDSINTKGAEATINSNSGLSNIIARMITNTLNESPMSKYRDDEDYCTVVCACGSVDCKSHKKEIVDSRNKKYLSICDSNMAEKIARLVLPYATPKSIARAKLAVFDAEDVTPRLKTTFAQTYRILG